MNTKAIRDSEGYLVDTEDWSKEWADMVAKEEGLTLNDKYWSVINFMRGYYDEHQIAPDVRHASKNLAAELGLSKKEGKTLLFELFPYGYVKQACKIAGMKKPRAWSTG